MSFPWYTEKMIKNYIREFQGNFNNTQDFIDEINSLLNDMNELPEIYKLRIPFFTEVKRQLEL